MEQSGVQVLLLVNFRTYTPRSPQRSEEPPIYIVQSERTTNSRTKMKMFSSFKHGVPSPKESAGHKVTSRHALAVSARILAVRNSEIYAAQLNNG